MQIDPLPIPTRKPSTPASIKFLACAAVTTVIRRTSLYAFKVNYGILRTVAANYLQVGVMLLDVLDHVNLEN